jgi:ankyrin repeat protein
LGFFQADVNAKNFSGYTPLHDAVDAGNVAIARMLISNEADLNLGNSNGSTPLHLAALWGNVDCVQLLLENGSDGSDVNRSDVNRSDVNRSDVNRSDVNRSDVNARNKFGNTPLHEAAWLVSSQMSSDEKVKCCKMLIQNRADVHAKNLKNNTPLDYPLMKEVKSKYPELFETIVE